MVTSTEAHINPAFEDDRPGEIRTINKQDIVGEPPPEEAQKKELTKEEKSCKWGILKNVIVISFAFTCLFASIRSVTNLQSSINRKLGINSLAMIFAGQVFSTIFLSSILIKKLKAKWTIVISMLCFSTYIVAQLYPRYYTLLPTSIILGLGSGSMFTAKCKYLITVGEKYAELVGETRDVIITRFFGIFFLFLHSSQVVGNFISSAVLSRDVISDSRPQDFLDHCGTNYCPNFSFNLTDKAATDTAITGEAHVENDRSKIMVISTICLVIALASSGLVAFFVDSLAKYEKTIKSSGNKSGLQLLMATLNQMKNPYQILIIPLTFWTGIEQGFFIADFTASFVTCALGVHMVGYVFMCYGVCDAVCSYSFAPLVKLVGRVPVFIFGTVLNVTMMIVMFFWRPDPDQIFIFFVIAALWGMSDSVWETQINAFYGVIFPEDTEASFSNYRLWKSLGHIAVYILSSSICVSSKLYVTLGILAVGMTGYITLEITEHLRKKKETEKFSNK